MNIKLWYSKHNLEWRWTLTDNSRPIIKQESGSQKDLRIAMNDIANTVEYLIDNNILDKKEY
jgi:hypothetical protein